MDKEALLGGFASVFSNRGDIRGYFAPGRVNLIGEHIDYNGGHVFPCALNYGNYVVARRREDRKLRFFSQNYPHLGILEGSLDCLKKNKNSWTNYPKGVMWAFEKNGHHIENGFDIFVYGNIPGSGLSSSAAVEVSIGTMIKDFYGFDVSPIDIALYGQKAENDFIGMNCGIMDQFASAMGKKDMAIYLDTHTLEYRYVPLVLEGYKIIVANSNKPHSLVTSHYNERRKECESALSDIQKFKNIDCLCKLSPSEFDSLKKHISKEVDAMRAEHAVYEEHRTQKAVECLEKNDLVSFGKLIDESGDSLKNLYDATCFEIDTLVDLAREQKGVLGSRETGGGWGGNTISIVENSCVEEFKVNVTMKYKEKTGLKCSIYELEVGDGGRRIF